MILVSCEHCRWTATAPDAETAVHWGDLHSQCVHAQPVSQDYLALADHILDHMVQTDEAKDAETDLLWLNVLTLQDAEFLMSLHILPT